MVDIIIKKDWDRTIITKTFKFRSKMTASWSTMSKSNYIAEDWSKATLSTCRTRLSKLPIITKVDKQPINRNKTGSTKDASMTSSIRCQRTRPIIKSTGTETGQSTTYMKAQEPSDISSLQNLLFSHIHRQSRSLTNGPNDWLNNSLHLISHQEDGTQQRNSKVVVDYSY